MQVIFYEGFSKDPRSTKKPSGGSTTFNCTLKDNCGMLNPTIILGLGFSEAPSASMYAEIPEFGRYYFVREWVWAGAMWEVSLAVDPMATYRGEIGSQEQYILRSSARNNDNITDALYPADGGYILKRVPIKGDPAGTSGNPWNGWEFTYDTGMYIIGVINNDTSVKAGAVSYYAFTPTGFRGFMGTMFNTLDWMQIDTAEISAELLKSLFNPIQYIVSCMWIPIYIDVGAPISSLPFGYWALPASGWKLDLSWYRMDATATVLRHPQAESEFSYLNLPPFMRYTVFFPGFGEIALDPMEMFSSPVIDFMVKLDLITGMGILEFRNAGLGGTVFHVSRSQIGIPIQISQMSTDVLGTAGSGLEAVGHAFSFDFGKAVAGIMSSVTSALPKLTSTGSNGSIIEYQGDPHILCEYATQVEINNAHAGKPLCEMHKPSSLRGYMMCENAKIELNATRDEINYVRDVLNGGFYYE